jgi:ABC-type transport system substrate-binding protein
MTRGFLSSIAGIALMTILLVITVLMIWQWNSTETDLKEVLYRLEAIESQIESGALAPASLDSPRRTGGIWGAPEPDYVTAALQDPKNLLERDTVPWLPQDATLGGTLLLHFGSDPKGFNPLAENGADVTEVHEFISPSLIKRHKSNTSLWGPELAYSLTSPDDGHTWIFKLREDFWWQRPVVDYPSGGYDWLEGDHKVTAHDVEFMLEMCMNAQLTGCAPLRSYYDDMISFGATDEYTFEIKFKTKLFSQRDVAIPSLTAYPEFLYAFDQAGVRYDDAVIGQKVQDHWYRLGIGCGPYQMTEFEAGVKIVLKRNPRFPLGGNAFDRVIYQILPDQNQPPRKLRTGELHLAYLQPGQYRTEVLDGAPDSPFKDGTLIAGEWWEHSWFYIGWNMRKPLFADKLVRKAMTHAFNADRLLSEIFMNLGERTTGPMPTFLPFYDHSVEAPPFDLELARKLLDEAGWTDSDGDGIRDKMVDGERKKFEFNLTVYGTSNEYRTVGTIFKEDLSLIGVKMTVVPLEWSLLLKQVQDREFDAVTLAWVGGPDVSGFNQIWHSKQVDIPRSSNHVGFANAEADAIIEELEITFDHARRVELANRFHQLLAEEQPYTFFYTRKRPGFWQPELGSVKFAMVRPYRNHKAWHLAPK